MRPALTAALVATLMLASAGAALAQSRDYDLTGFQRLDIANGIIATVQPGDDFAVSVETNNQDLLDKLIIEVNDGELAASFDQNFFDFIMNGGIVGKMLSPPAEVRLTVSLPELTGVSASSDANVDVAAFAGASFELDISSGAHVTVAEATVGAVTVDISSGSRATLRGTCETLDVGASSGSNLDAGQLSCKSARVEASSGSSASVSASTSVSANASSGGDIRVLGNPAEDNVQTSSGGDVNIVR